MQIIVDTGPLVALLNRRDHYHTWSVAQAGRLAPPFFCCEAVVAEAHFLLRHVNQGNRRLNDLLTSGRMVLSWSLANHHSRVATLMKTYDSVPMSFADACQVCMAEQIKSSILTLDSDFRIYRRHQREPLELIIP